MARTFLQALEELDKLYDKIISLEPYINDPEVSRELRELRSKTSRIEALVVE
jgi:hypothetical protein